MNGIKTAAQRRQMKLQPPRNFYAPGGLDYNRSVVSEFNFDRMQSSSDVGLHSRHDEGRQRKPKRPKITRQRPTHCQSPPSPLENLCSLVSPSHLNSSCVYLCSSCLPIRLILPLSILMRSYALECLLSRTLLNYSRTQHTEAEVRGLHPSIVIDPRRFHLTLGVMALDEERIISR
jgi:hypothetical protein